MTGGSGDAGGGGRGRAVDPARERAVLGAERCRTRRAGGCPRASTAEMREPHRRCRTRSRRRRAWPAESGPAEASEMSTQRMTATISATIAYGASRTTALARGDPHRQRPSCGQGTQTDPSSCAPRATGASKSPETLPREEPAPCRSRLPVHEVEMTFVIRAKCYWSGRYHCLRHRGGTSGTGRRRPSGWGAVVVMIRFAPTAPDQPDQMRERTTRSS